MARVAIWGWELQALGEFISTGVADAQGTIETSIVRSGSASWKCAPASGANARFLPAAAQIAAGEYHRFYLRVTARPASSQRMIWGNSSTGHRLGLNANGTLQFFNAANASMGTSAVALTDTTKWYRIETRFNTGVGLAELKIDGVSQVTGTSTQAISRPVPGCTDTVADTFTGYFDDYVIDDAAYPGDSKVVLLLPTADSARGTGWVGGAGGTTNLFEAVNNTPPVGAADTGTDTSQIRNATAAANSNMDFTMTTYAAAGIAATDTINSVVPIIITAAPVTTSSKQGTVGVVSNPAITNVALNAEGTAGAFWAGAAASTWKTGWKLSSGTFTASPSVTVGTAPVMRVTQVTSSTRIADVCFMGMYVDYTPAVAASLLPPRRHRNLIIR